VKLFDILFQAVRASLYSAEVATGSVHVRDRINHRRVMNITLLALLPCIVMAVWNSGYQANLTLNQMLAAGQIDALPKLSDSTHFCNNLFQGFKLFVPMLVVSLVSQAIWIVVFAAMRKKSIGTGFFVTSVLITLLMPSTAPLWQVALATTFGVVIGREIFGGLGMNFLNPALLAWAFMSWLYRGNTISYGSERRSFKSECTGNILAVGIFGNDSGNHG